MCRDGSVSSSPDSPAKVSGRYSGGRKARSDASSCACRAYAFWASSSSVERARLARRGWACRARRRCRDFILPPPGGGEVSPGALTPGFLFARLLELLRQLGQLRPVAPKDDYQALHHPRRRRPAPLLIGAHRVVRQITLVGDL